MKLYHGGLQIVQIQEIRQINRTLDYGKGFYTTTSYNQAKNWVLRHVYDNPKPLVGYVNIYEADLETIRRGNCLWFAAPTEEWVDFVYANRNDRTFVHQYDFVYGPVANDRVYAAFTLYENGLLNKHELILELKAYKLVDQLLFHTPLALRKLTYIEAIEIVL